MHEVECVQGQIPHDVKLLWDIKVNAQVFQRAAVDESLRVKYVILKRMFCSITIF